ncbi:hypothetical protein MYXA107069_37955 [Myxococcus xanthus]
MPRTSTTDLARKPGLPTTWRDSFRVPASARRKRASDSRWAWAGVDAEVGWTLVVLLRSCSDVVPVRLSTTSRKSARVVRSTVALLAWASMFALAMASRPRTPTWPTRRPSSDSTMTERMSPRPGSAYHHSTWVGAAAWFRGPKERPLSSTWNSNSSRAARRRRNLASVSPAWWMVSKDSPVSSTWTEPSS